MTPKAIAAASTHFLQFRLQYSSLALLYYDFALTFPKEVKYMWGQRFRLSTALYIGCRYALVANVLYMLAIANKLGSTHPQCDSWYKVVGALSIIGRAAVIAVFTMRTYAVFGKNKWVLTYMGVVGLACVALDITHVPGMRCVGSASLPIMISIFTTAAVILNYRAPPGFFQRLPNAYTLPLSCILTARFILFLREWDAKQVAGKSDATEASMPEFRAASRVGVVSSMVAVDDFGTDPVVISTRNDHSIEMQRQAADSGSDIESTEAETLGKEMFKKYRRFILYDTIPV
ncbi:hypothetical protein B0H11DRAFT_2356679 [Mycena galericulata]|nr:hypothetical protein B0H11DRAFT_2356679 [Mycena galericulata]